MLQICSKSACIQKHLAEEEQQDAGCWGINDEEITEEELNEAFSEGDKKDEELRGETSSKVE